MADEQDLLDYDEPDEVPRKEDKNTNNGVTSIQNGSSTGTQSGAIRGSYVSIHASGFKDFLLKPELLRSIMDCGFEHPSEVQHECIPQAILGTDIVCQAKSGMGKTAVFVLATLQQLEPVDGQVSVIVLCHARELAFQISREYERFCKYMPAVKVSVFFGGLPTKNDEDVLKKNCPHIVVGTPGRILALAKSKVLNLRYVKHFVIDECDKVLESLDMRRDVQEIFKMTPHEKQVLMFSATLSKDIRPVCKKFMQQPMEIYIDNETKLTLHVNCGPQYSGSWCSISGAPGKLYYGRGWFQLSWPCNYYSAGQSLGVDLLADPDKVENDPQVAVSTALWFYDANGMAAPAQIGDFASTTRLINGAIECNNGPGYTNQLTRVETYKRVRLCFNLGAPTINPVC
ncbi:unnamed protein product [Rotaria sp. Silwood2]|nr:unnamed protein product [Rotaria sp. Silwood2]